MFFINNAADITSYVEGKTPQGAEKNQCELEKKLQKSPAELSKWFHKNGVKAKQDHCNFV